MASLPKVQMFNKTNPVKSKPGLASKIALIGAFDSTESEPILFTDIDEFKKVFYDYREDIYPQVYNFADLVNDANEDLVINPASESFELSPEIFK